MRQLVLVIAVVLLAVPQVATPAPKAQPATCGDVKKRMAELEQRERALDKREADIARRESVQAKLDERARRMQEEIKRHLLNQGATDRPLD